MKPGEMLGPYRVVSALGAGGMGEVYRARDTTLDREVAIKILPESFASDPDRLMRFEREAKALAALNHPNIAQIYGLEKMTPGIFSEDGAPEKISGVISSASFLVMELVEGKDLSERIGALGPGGLPLDDALPIARQIADALEAAHAQGIVHRDLKPANIKVRADGVVKVLDFGLAKAMAGPSGPALQPDGRTTDGGPDLQVRADSPTMTSPAMTAMGVVLGTAAYMAPEQARGRQVDHRADIWAFGVVLGEMLSGRHAFKGEDITETLAAVVKSPPNLDGLPAETPEAIRRLLRRCLEKDPRKRLSSIADARLELDDAESAGAAGAAEDAPAATQAIARRSLGARLWPALAAVVFTLAAVAAISPWNRSPVDDGVTRTTILLPPDTGMLPDAYQAAISPDGTTVALTVITADGNFELWVRSLDAATPRRLNVEAGAYGAFWNPAGTRIGFFSDGKLKTVAATGGRADELCDAPNARGGTWSESDVIVFSPNAGGPLYRVPATSGVCEAVTTLDATKNQVAHRFPTMLPDDDHFLYAAVPGLRGEFDIFVGSLLDDSTTFVASLESAPVFAEPGWLLFARQGGLAAQAFDPATLTLSGNVVTLDDEPARELNPDRALTAAPVVSVSRTGSLVYTSVPSTNTTAIWHDEQGRPTGTFDLRPARYDVVKVAPDGEQAIFVRSESASESTLWLANLSSGTAVPLPTGPGRNTSPVWSPDSRQVAYASDRDGPQDIYVIDTGDAAKERALHQSDVPFRSPGAWSRGPDGTEWIVVTQLDPDPNVWLLSPDSGHMQSFVMGPGVQGGGTIDPTGRWLAYLSDETGQTEVYLQAFPDGGQKIPVTRQGAWAPMWLRERLLFQGLEHLSLWESPLGGGATPRPGTPRQLAAFPAGTLSIAPLPDGRFLSIAPESTDGITVTLVRNWLKALPER